MSNISNVKPWFREDLARTLMSIYFASVSSGSFKSGDGESYRVGFATALSSVALAVGVNPENILAPEDIKLIQGINSQS